MPPSIADSLTAPSTKLHPGDPGCGTPGLLTPRPGDLGDLTLASRLPHDTGSPRTKPGGVHAKLDVLEELLRSVDRRVVAQEKLLTDALAVPLHNRTHRSSAIYPSPVSAYNRSRSAVSLSSSTVRPPKVLGPSASNISELLPMSPWRRATPKSSDTLAKSLPEDVATQDEDVTKPASPKSPSRLAYQRTSSALGGFGGARNTRMTARLSMGGQAILSKTGFRCLRPWVEDTRFEAFFGVAIVINSIFIGVEVENAATTLSTTAPTFIVVISYMFNAIFLLELIVRLLALGMDFFKCTTPGWVWNYLDFFLVVSSVVETAGDVAVLLMRGTVGGSADANLSQMRLLRVVRIARLVRMMRIARVVRFVRALRVLLHTLMTTFKSLMWVLMLVAIVIYFFGVLFTQAVSTRRMAIFDGEFGLSGDPALFEAYWASLDISMLTLFKAITNGVDWEQPMMALTDVGWVWAMIFIVFIAFVHFMLLNVVTGVFCQSAIEGAQYDKDLFVQELLASKQHYVDKACDLFAMMYDRLADASGNKAVTIESFQNNMHDSAVQAYFALLDMDAADAFTLFKMLDAEGTNAIDAEEFVEGCLRFKGGARSIDLMKLTYETRWLTRQFIDFTQDVEKSLNRLHSKVVRMEKANLAAHEPLMPSSEPQGVYSRIGGGSGSKREDSTEDDHQTC